MWCHFLQCSLEIGSASRKGQQDRGRWVVHMKGANSTDMSGLNFKASWLALGGPFLLSYAQMGTSSSWLRIMTIASSLMNVCGLSHKHVENGCKGTCVRFVG